MGKLELFEIILRHPQAVYMPGQIIEGQVNVQLNAEMKMRGIRLLFSGSANVHWTERHTTGSGKNRRTHVRHYSANESYFHQQVTLYGKFEGQGGDNPVLPPGTYSYPFSFQLPQALPSSFEGAWGYVRYLLKGTIDRPWRFDHNTKRVFTVLSMLDLNMEPNATVPFQGSNQKTLCCLCCKSGPISAVLNLERRGFVPGEWVAIMGEISNMSNRNMTCSKATLTQHIGFHATSKSRWANQTVQQIQKGSIGPGESDLWNERLHIPPLPPSHLAGCRIIDIKYLLTLVVDPAGPGFDLEVPAEVIIGTIPLRQVFTGWSNQGNLYNQPTAGPVPQPVMPPPPQDPSGPIPSAPPPAYEECVFGKVDIHDDDDNEYTRGERNWAPVYTYYNWDQPATQPMK